MANIGVDFTDHGWERRMHGIGITGVSWRMADQQRRARHYGRAVEVCSHRYGSWSHDDRTLRCLECGMDCT